MATTDTFPLKWPANQERTPHYSRKNSQFKTSPGRARDELLKELKMLNASNVVISTNVETYERGGQQIQYVNQMKSQSDPGVAVYFTWKGGQYCFACDLYKSVPDNIQALNKTINAIRGIERWGSGGMIKAAFAGFAELPAPDATVEPWWEVLNVRKDASIDEIKSAYRNKAWSNHPDRGGSSQMMQKINDAYQKATQ